MSGDVMIVVNTDFVPGKEIVEIVGLVRGNTIRAKHLGKDLMAGLRNIVGGELTEYSEMISEAREEALNRMIDEAEKLGADAVINLRLTTSQVAAGAAEILAYGTAVTLK
ncbi:MAG: YbjQ family protein [Theionarchaea archaeon]|nr:YbjQ family protein [Theionarchaea archaeon]